MLAGFDVGPQCTRLSTVLVGTELQCHRAAAVVELQLGAAHDVPGRLLAGHQNEQNRGARTARAVVVRRRVRMAQCQLTAPDFAESAAFGMRTQLQLPDSLG